MKNKHILVWVMLLSLTVGLFSGCSSQNPTETPQPSETVPTTAAPTQPTATLPPQTEAPTLPPQTEAPTQPKDMEPVLMDLTREERYEINIFLSNFSEQWFHEAYRWDDNHAIFYADTGSIAEITEFVWHYAKLNCYSELQYINSADNSYYAFHLSVLEPIAQRFFGRSLPEEELRTMQSEYFFLKDAMVCGPAADGETFTNMTVTENMYDLGDGTMLAEFSIYDAWNFSDVGGTVMEKDLYYLTAEQARDNPDLELHLSGAAIVRPQTLDNGRNTYQLVSYELYN